MSNTVTLRARLAEEVNRSPSDIIGPRSLAVGLVINREINSAIRHYESGRFRWNEVREATLATTVSGTRTYSLTANFLQMDSLKFVYSTSYIPLLPAAWDEIETRDRTVTGSVGLPSIYSIYGNVIRLFPVPNGSYTLIGSYIRRYLPTSLTGSYTTLQAMAGSYTLSTTSTASHNSRTDGWTTDGEELIRARAKAGFLIRYEVDESAIAEMRLLQGSREPFLSIGERQAFERLIDETNDALATGFIKPYFV